MGIEHEDGYTPDEPVSSEASPSSEVGSGEDRENDYDKYLREASERENEDEHSKKLSGILADASFHNRDLIKALGEEEAGNLPDDMKQRLGSINLLAKQLKQELDTFVGNTSIVFKVGGARTGLN